MVRRLVEEQDVRLAEQHARHRDAHLPAARQRADIAVDLCVLETEAREHVAGLRLEGVATKVVVLLLYFAEALQDPIHVIGLVGVAHGVLQRLELVMQRADTSAAGDGLVEHRAAAHLLDVLAEVPDGEPPGHGDVALVGRFLAHDHPEQRGLARAVRARRGRRAHLD